MKKQKNKFLTIGGVLMLGVTLLMFPLFPQVSFADSKSFDSMFSSSSFTFHLDLAKTSLQLSAAAYGESSADIDALLSGLGFTNDHKYDAGSYTQSKEKGTNSVAFSLATKKISSEGKVYDLIALVIRGTYSDNEWISNFNINNSGNYPLVHEGFSKAEKEVLAALQQYATALGTTPSNTKLLITGHSRGAAVANLLAADLMGPALSSDESIATPGNIYTYTFATPNVVMLNGHDDDSASPENFLNIFNAVDAADIITQIPFDSWGYGKYGVTYTLPEYTAAQKENANVTRSVLTKFLALAPTVDDFYKQQLGAVFLEGSQIPKSCMEAHVIDSYAQWLNNADHAALEKQISDNQFSLMPNGNYA